MMAKKIPLFIIEEHNEAFFLWSYFRKRNRNLSGELVHVDEHADLACARSDLPFRELDRRDDRAVLRFTVDNLGIDTFISAAFHYGLVHTCHWVKNVEMKSYTESFYVACEDESGTKLSMNKATELNEGVFSLFNRGTVSIHGGPEALPEDRNVLLDVDIDYFSSNVKPENFGFEIQVAKKEFDAFNETPYHPLRLVFTQVRSERRGASYYLRVNDFTRPIPSPRRCDAPSIAKNAAGLACCLARKRIVPELVTVCRSRHSNYTPRDQWEYIEETLVRELSRVYDLKISYLPDFLRGKGLI